MVHINGRGPHVATGKTAGCFNCWERWRGDRHANEATAVEYPPCFDSYLLQKKHIEKTQCELYNYTPHWIVKGKNNTRPGVRINVNIESRLEPLVQNPHPRGKSRPTLGI